MSKIVVAFARFVSRRWKSIPGEAHQPTAKDIAYGFAKNIDESAIWDWRGLENASARARWHRDRPTDRPERRNLPDHTPAL
jgi:hypothetical protein